MNKPKPVFGIVLALFGLGTLLAGVIPGIGHIISGSYRDITTIPISLSQPKGSHQKIRFHTRGQVDFSFWLKLPDRSIENKKFRFKVALISDDGRRRARFGENFRFGYLRSNTDSAHYYKLGRYRTQNEFAGYLEYQSSGKWRPAHDGAIVLRRREGVELPVESITISVLGLFGMLLGIGTVVKYRPRPTVRPSGTAPVRAALCKCRLLKNQDTIPN